MRKLNRNDIQIIKKHSNWQEKDIDITLKKEIYSNKESWKKFLELFFISLGIGFTTIGIIFFFAYNWDNLHKFAKIGLIKSLIIIITLIAVFSKININFKNILLTCATMLVGVLYAVFGQIYQTGANAYDFFLGWTLSVMLWVIIANFAPLWVVFITLINTTFVLYSQQVAHHWSPTFICSSLIIINTLFLIFFLFKNKIIKSTHATPIWFTNLIALVVVVVSTIGVIYTIVEEKFSILIPITLIIYIAGIFYGLKAKRSFYLATIPFSIIVMISSFFIRESQDIGTFFFVTLFVIGSVTLVIKNLISLGKKWEK